MTAPPAARPLGRAAIRNQPPPHRLTLLRTAADSTQRLAGRLALLSGDAPWLLAIASGVVVLCALPYVVSAALGPRDLERLGTFWFVRDFSQYQAAMREGARQSSWLIHDHFSVEPHTAALMYPLYVGLGKLAALLNVNPLTAFTVMEWLGRLFVVAALYVFARTFLSGTRQRRLALLLALGTLGLDAVAAPVRMAVASLGVQVAWLPETIDPYLEISSSGVLLSAPHLMLALGLSVLAAPLYLEAVHAGRAGRRLEPVDPSSVDPLRRRVFLLLLALDVLALSVVQAFNLPVLLSVLVIHALMTGRRAWSVALIAVAAATPMLVYSGLLYTVDPFWAGTYGVQNKMPSPPPWALPFDFGVVLLAAPLAWPIIRAWPAEWRRLILLWVMLGLIWMYVPVPYQRRFAFGVQPALAVLAAVGLSWVNCKRWWPRGMNLVVALAAVATSVLVYCSLIASAALNWPAEVYLWSRPEAAAAAWLGDNSTVRDVVLASTEFANPLAGSIDGRVVHGHVVATLDSDAKSALVRQFYAPTTSIAERAALLAQSQATFVAVGPRERALGAGDLSGQPELHLVYDHQGVQLWRVQPRLAGAGA